VQGSEPALVHAGEQLLLPGLGHLASIARRWSLSQLTVIILVISSSTFYPLRLLLPSTFHPHLTLT
jgi:hypothetical protein